MDHSQCPEEHDGTHPLNLIPRRFHLPGQSSRGRGIRICAFRKYQADFGKAHNKGEKGRILLFYSQYHTLYHGKWKNGSCPHLGQHTAQFLKNIPRRRDFPMNKILIDLQHITKSFDGQMVLDDLNLYIRENEFLTLLGPSGCGKTTTLRILGGFETPDQGKVIFDGADITKMPPNKRQLNTVFQKYALFTHMTIDENIAFGLKIKKKTNNEIQKYINKKYQKSYTINYISTIFRQKIIPSICEAVEYHQEIIGNLFFEENFKKCSMCGKELLLSKYNFIKKSRSKDGYSNRCKICEKEERKRKKENN